GLHNERNRIAAATISPPDPSHPASGLLALKAGKHTYIQKPLARTMGEVRALADYTRSHPKLMTQMGNQGHAREGTRQIREWVEAGAIGTVREVRLLDQPADLAAGDRTAARGVLRSGHARLEPVARP